MSLPSGVTKRRVSRSPFRPRPSFRRADARMHAAITKLNGCGCRNLSSERTFESFTVPRQDLQNHASFRCGRTGFVHARESEGQQCVIIKGPCRFGSFSSAGSSSGRRLTVLAFFDRMWGSGFWMFEDLDYRVRAFSFFVFACLHIFSAVS